LIPAVFGQRWDDAVPLVFALALALVICGSAVTFGVGLLLAANHAKFATLSAVSCTVLLLLTLALFHSFGGLRALAIAWDTSAVVETTIIVVACQRFLGVRLATGSLLPVPVFVAAYLGGWVAAQGLSGWLVPSLVAAGTAGVISIALSAPLAWQPSKELFRATRRPAEAPAGN
jgi:O-antigen/teichoic acid export membrane protein